MSVLMNVIAVILKIMLDKNVLNVILIVFNVKIILLNVQNVIKDNIYFKKNV
jgi:hypothetical protein